MTTYVDSSALVPVYVSERFSKRARAVVRTLPQVPFTAIHQLEVSNALESMVGRRLISRDECRAVGADLKDDLENQRLVLVPIDLDRLYAEAGELSRLYTARFLARSLDLLHVAAAHMTRCTRFVSADNRQLAVAKATGLATVDIKPRMPRRKP